MVLNQGNGNRDWHLERNGLQFEDFILHCQNNLPFHQHHVAVAWGTFIKNKFWDLPTCILWLAQFEDAFFCCRLLLHIMRRWLNSNEFNRNTVTVSVTELLPVDPNALHWRTELLCYSLHSCTTLLHCAGHNLHSYLALLRCTPPLHSLSTVLIYPCLQD